MSFQDWNNIYMLVALALSLAIAYQFRVLWWGYLMVGFGGVVAQFLGAVVATLIFGMSHWAAWGCGMVIGLIAAFKLSQIAKAARDEIESGE